MVNFNHYFPTRPQLNEGLDVFILGARQTGGQAKGTDWLEMIDRSLKIIVNRHLE
jgi:hypothetical protein